MSALPAVHPQPPIQITDATDRTLANGLRVVVVPRSSVPRVEVRLLVPMGQVATSVDHACASLLARTLTSGTQTRDASTIAAELQGWGARLAASGDIEQLVIGGGVLAPYFGDFLVLVGDVVRSPTFPEDEVSLKRELLARELGRAASDAGSVAVQALLRAIYGTHPYGRAMPDPAALPQVAASALRLAHRERVGPAGAVLVVVGDVNGSAVIEHAERAFVAWATTAAVDRPTPPKPPNAVVTRVIDRAGAVQTALRVGAPAVTPDHPDFPALAVVNNLVGGHSSSRLSLNLRERNGYAYAVGCAVQRRLQAAYVQVVTDVATDATAPALVELRSELARVGTEPVPAAELELARRSLAGNLCLSMQTQSGLATGLASVTSYGLGPEYLEEQLAAIARVTEEDVLRVAAQYLAPTGLQTVLVGDADRVLPAVRALGDPVVDSSS